MGSNKNDGAGRGSRGTCCNSGASTLQRNGEQPLFITCYQVDDAKDGDPHQKLLDQIESYRSQQKAVLAKKIAMKQKIDANQVEASEIRRTVEAQVPSK